MEPPAADERAIEEEDDDDPEPPMQRQRGVDRKELEDFVRCELSEIFDSEEDESFALEVSATPRKFVMDSLEPLLSCPAVLFHTMRFLSPCEIQSVLQSNKQFYNLTSSMELQKILLESIFAEFSIFSCHADLVFRNPQFRRMWIKLFCWLDRTMEKDQVHRALLAEQTIVGTVDGRAPLYFRTAIDPPTTVNEFLPDTPNTHHHPTLPSAQKVRKPPYPFRILHGSFDWFSWDCERIQSIVEGYQLVLLGADGCGGFLHLFLQKNGTLYEFIDNGQLDPSTSEYSTLPDLLCNANYVCVDNDQPYLDHQLCALAWLVAHRFPPFQVGSKALGRVQDQLLFSTRFLSSLPDIEDEDYAGNVKEWTASFLEAAADGSMALAKASDYV